MDATSESDLRHRLAEVDAAIRSHSRVEFASLHALNVEADEIRAELQRRLAPDITAARKTWAERSGRKASHEEDPELAKLRIVGDSEVT